MTDWGDESKDSTPAIGGVPSQESAPETVAGSEPEVGQETVPTTDDNSSSEGSTVTTDKPKDLDSVLLEALVNAGDKGLTKDAFLEGPDKDFMNSRFTNPGTALYHAVNRVTTAGLMYTRSGTFYGAGYGPGALPDQRSPMGSNTKGKADGKANSKGGAAKGGSQGSKGGQNPPKPTNPPKNPPAPVDPPPPQNPEPPVKPADQPQSVGSVAAAPLTVSRRGVAVRFTAVLESYDEVQKIRLMDAENHVMAVALMVVPIEVVLYQNAYSAGDVEWPNEAYENIAKIEVTGIIDGLLETTTIETVGFYIVLKPYMG